MSNHLLSEFDSRVIDYRRRMNMGFGNRSFGGPREMHKVICSDCGQETEVPFKPAEGRPVYCKECYTKHRPVRE